MVSSRPFSLHTQWTLGPGAGVDVGVVPQVLRRGRKETLTCLTHEGNLSCEQEDDAKGNVWVSQTKVCTHAESGDIYFERQQRLDENRR